MCLCGRGTAQTAEESPTQAVLSRKDEISWNSLQSSLRCHPTQESSFFEGRGGVGGEGKAVLRCCVLQFFCESQRFAGYSVKFVDFHDNEDKKERKKNAATYSFPTLPYMYVVQALDAASSRFPRVLAPCCRRLFCVLLLLLFCLLLPKKRVNNPKGSLLR